MASVIEPGSTLHVSYQVMQSRGADLGWLLRVLVRQPLATLGVWLQRHQERRALAAMNARMLRDLGLTQAAVQHEVRKPVWEV